MADQPEELDDECSPGKIVDARYAYTPEYEKALREIEASGICPFCYGNGKPMLAECGDWYLVECTPPHKNAKLHFLILPKDHRTDISELTKRDTVAKNFLVKWFREKYAPKGFGECIRHGEGVSIRHAHIHLIVPDFDGDAVYFGIGK